MIIPNNQTITEFLKESELAAFYMRAIGPHTDAQRRAAAEAAKTNLPVDDGYGCRWHPPGADGVPIVSKTPS